MSKQLLGVYLISSLAMAGVFCVVPALPVIAQGLNITNAQASNVIVAFTLGNILFAPFAGLVADTVGRRKVLVPSLFGFGLAGVACAAVNSYEWLLFFRFLQGVSSAAMGPVAVAVLADLSSGEQRVRYFGYNMTATSIGMMLFPFVGGLLVTESWRYPFLLTAVALPVALYCFIYLRYDEKLSDKSLKTFVQHFYQALFDRRVVLISLVNFSAFIVFSGAFLSFFALLMRDKFGEMTSINNIMSVSTVMPTEVFTGVAIMLFSAMVGLLSFRLGKLHSVFGFNKVLAGGFLGYGLAIFALQYFQSVNGILVAVALLGAAHGSVIPSIVALYTKLAPVGMTGSFIVLNSIIFRLGQMLGPVLMAWVLLGWDVQAVFVLAAALTVPVFFIAALTQWRPSKI